MLLFYLRLVYSYKVYSNLKNLIALGGHSYDPKKVIVLSKHSFFQQLDDMRM